MGDNRDDSLDSRFWGFVPLQDVIGTPMVVYWSWDPKIPIYDLFDKLGSINLRRIGTIVR
jgi:signal peptidase I